MTQIITLTRKVGDTLTPLSLMITDSNDDPISLAGKTVTFDMEDDAGTAVITDGVCVAEPTQTFTVAAATPDVTIDVDHRVLAIKHGYQDGYQLVLTSTGALPAGLQTSRRYFVKNATPNDFQLEYRPGGGGGRFYPSAGSLVEITDTGTGIHSMYAIGHLTFDFPDDKVNETGTFPAAVKLDDSGEVDTYPGGDVELQIIFQERL